MHTLGLSPMKVELQDIISEVDTDGSSSIDFYKFLDLIAKTERCMQHDVCSICRRRSREAHVFPVTATSVALLE
uniref:EF-hand domain-containing protein n=1 Tax=Oryza sativa subsp. japonica TaxID=39947 RepID=Q6EP50_ORYSJ|nr:hypothetical protein [Oryza sativa Japonica Group]